MKRPLPWRADRDPYRIWVAEVILQQTRVAQALPYYVRFVREFPTVGALASAPLDRVLKVWEGAGYYARARHLHAAAVWLVREGDGHVPTTVAELQQLPGVGPYIARAVAAIAFDAPVIALEANGLRVGARWIRAAGDARSGPNRHRIEAALFGTMDRLPPGEFNEAIMELGETICLPTSPRCGVCPVAATCRAFQELPDPGSVPSRRTAAPRPHVRASVVVLEDENGRWLVQRRPERGLLGGLWEFPGGKIHAPETPEEAARRELREETGGRAGPLKPVGIVRHGYSHFTVDLHVFRGPARTPRPSASATRRWIRPEAMHRLAIPKATEKALVLLRASRPTDRANRAGGRRRPTRRRSRNRG